MADVGLQAGFPCRRRALWDDRLPAGGIKQLGAVGKPDLKPIAKFGHRPDRRARGADGIALLDRDGRPDVFGGVERGRGE